MPARVLRTMRRTFRCLTVIVAVATCLAHLARPTAAEPAMWVVRDEDSTIYLLGTFHWVKSGTQWRSDKIDTAFRRSDELWLESVEGGVSESLRLLLLTHGMDPARPLSTKLDAGQLVALDEAAKGIGLRAAHFDTMRPWLAALTLAFAPLERQGYDATEAVDRSLDASARRMHKRVEAFETAEQQILFFAGLSEESELAYLSQTLRDVAAGQRYVDQMAEAWMAGNVEQLNAMVLKSMKSAAAELYDTLIVQRNLDWCDKIAEIMQGSGTSFVAVGAGHLIGDKGVPAILAKRGFQVAPY